MDELDNEVFNAATKNKNDEEKYTSIHNERGVVQNKRQKRTGDDGHKYVSTMWRRGARHNPYPMGV